jgi:hypothetical protein
MQAFERNLSANSTLTYPQSLAIFDMLYHEAVSLGVITTENAMDGIDNTIRMSRIIHALSVRK